MLVATSAQATSTHVTSWEWKEQLPRFLARPRCDVWHVAEYLKGLLGS